MRSFKRTVRESSVSHWEAATCSLSSDVLWTSLKRAESEQKAKSFWCSLEVGHLNWGRLSELTFSSWANWKRASKRTFFCSRRCTRLSELRSPKQTDFGSGASFLVLAYHFLHKLGRIRHVKHKRYKYNN